MTLRVEQDLPDSESQTTTVIPAPVLSTSLEGTGLSTAGNEMLEFQCPKCGKKLKANRKVAGKRVKCPQCMQPVKVPGSVPDSTDEGDDWLNLGSVSDLEDAFSATPASPTTQDVAKAKSSGDAANPTPTQRKNSVAAPAPKPPSATEAAGKQQRSATAPVSNSNQVARTVFDEDLPDLTNVSQADLDTIGAEPKTSSQQKTPQQKPRKSTPPSAAANEDLLGIDAIVGDDLAPPAEYRIVCKNCGTPQYVREAQQGKKIQCPDCYIEFAVPAPPPNWLSNKAKPTVKREEVLDVKLAPIENVAAQRTTEQEKARADAIMDRARRELDDQIDELYEPDFDTKGFLVRTFGFAMGSIGALQLLLYGLMFGLFFGVLQFSAIQYSKGDRGFVFLVPMVAMFASLVSMPMLSGGIALVESVANGRKKVLEWPNFNLFDNLSDILLIGSALAGSMLLGLIVGGMAGRFFGNYMLTLVCILGTTFLLFPIFLLSMLDNGSLFQPLSVAVFRSISGVPEEWGAYYLKTFMAFAFVQVAWFILLGRSPLLASLAGSLLPTLMFFTCQQAGVLAHGIAEHLSFEFVDEAGAKK